MRILREEIESNSFPIRIQSKGTDRVNADDFF